jgi:hypothetical protein
MRAGRSRLRGNRRRKYVRSKGMLLGKSRRRMLLREGGYERLLWRTRREKERDGKR